MTEIAKRGNHVFNAIRGIQSGREYYTAMLPLRYVEKLLSDGSEADQLPATMRYQRQTNKSRAKKIARYLLDNVNDRQTQYTLPSLTISVDTPTGMHTEFTAYNESNAGSLAIPVEAIFLVNDGLHRRAGIVEALRKLTPGERRKMSRAAIKKHEAAQEALRDESITLTIFVAAGARRAQQMFVDINKNASKPNPALSMTFDHRDQINAIARDVAENVTGFRGRIEFERATAKDKNLFSINAIAASVKTLLDAWGETEEKKVREFFDVLVREMGDNWITKGRLIEILGGAEAEDLPASIARQNIALEAITEALASQDNWKKLAKRLGEIDWNRDADEWAEINVVVDGRILKNRRTVAAMAGSIRRSLKSA